MVPALALALLLAQSAPPPWEGAQLLFLQGDLARAEELAHGCAARADPKCQRQLEALARYAFLAHRADALARAEAAQFVALDRQLGNGTPARLTRPVLARFVEQPLALARARLAAGQILDAWALVAEVLEVDPTNAEAQRLFR